MSKKMRIPFFRAGKHTDNKGNSHDFTEDDLKAVVKNYDPKLFKSPIVIGHPKDNDPSFGWVDSIEYDEATKELVAIATATDVQFAEDVAAKKYKNVSGSFYPKGSSHNPIKDKNALYPRHIGFLGAVPPAIKNLSPVEFNDLNEFISFDFNEVQVPTVQASTGAPIDKPNGNADEELKNLIKQMSQELANLKEGHAKLAEENRKLREAQQAETIAAVKEANTEFTEGLIKGGRLLPCHRATVITLLNSAPSESIEFNEAQKPFNELLKEFLEKAPKVVEFGEAANKEDADDSDPETMQYAEGTAADSIMLDQKIKKYQRKHPEASYSTAFQAVKK